MRSKAIRIFFILIFIVVACIGVNKGCSSSEFPKQHPATAEQKASFKKGFVIPSDSFITVAAGKRYVKGGLHEFVFGKQHRGLWGLEVRMPVLNVSEVKGGLKIVKLGGNIQTLNFRVIGNDGKTYVLRTIDKDQGKILPKLFRNRITVFITRDFVSSLNPYGAFVVPHLAGAIGLIHTNPELYFIPYDPNFGEYAELIEGRVALLEEFPDDTWAGSSVFGYARSFESSGNMLEQRFKSNSVTISDSIFARNRLFDHLIGDWDRHIDQFRWGVFPTDTGAAFVPIPRDRDIALFHIREAIFPRLVLLANNKFQSFDPYYGNIVAMTKNSTYLDDLLFQETEKEMFLKIARDLQKILSDSVIENAVKKWPPEVYQMAGAETIHRLKSRRDKLEELANDYYNMLFKEARIVGSDERERFVIERKDDNHTSVIVFNERGKAYYHHIFDHSITREISIFGLNGDDSFLVKGKVDKGIVIKIYGGEDNDEIIDQSIVRGYQKKTKIYDTESGNRIEAGEETKDLTTSNPGLLFFDRSGARK